MLRFAAALALCLAVQDEDQIRDLIGKLEDDAFEVRDGAQRDLVRIGEAAASALRRTVLDARGSKARGELLLRAEAALREIELATKSKAVCPDPRPVTHVAKGVPLAEVSAELGRQSGNPIDASGADPTSLVDLNVVGLPLFRALDELCLGQNARSWELKDDRIVLTRERHVSYPSSYAGAFRTRITSMRLVRSTEFKGRAATLTLVLEADHEPSVKPSKGRQIEITRASDDRGTALEFKEGEEAEEGAVAGRLRINRAWLRAGAAGGAPVPAGQTYLLKGLHPEARKVSLQGQVRFRFPLDRSELRFEHPQEGETREVGEYTLRLENPGGRRWTLAFRKTKGPTSSQLAEELNRRLDVDSAVAVDEDGTEHRGTLAPSGDTMSATVVIVNGVAQESVEGLSYAFQFPALKAKALKELRFRFAHKDFEKSFPFLFEGVDLP